MHPTNMNENVSVLLSCHDTPKKVVHENVLFCPTQLPTCNDRVPHGIHD